ncbi:MAG: alginate export family protein [Lentisphaeria bacterium]
MSNRLSACAILGGLLAAFGAQAQSPAPAAATTLTDTAATAPAQPLAREAASYTPGKGYEIRMANGQRLLFGADLRLRFDWANRATALGPDYQMRGVPSGPNVSYERLRTRVWGQWDISPDVTLFTRLANEWRHYESSPNLANNNDWRTAEFPDEVVFDNLYLDVKNLFDSNWSLRLGRQDFVGPNAIGNSMIIGDGTPGDSSRTYYFDGVTATYQDGDDTLKLLALYSRWRDWFVRINSEDNRRLARGNSFLFGPYWTHKFTKAFNTDLYYLYEIVNSDYDTNQSWSAANNQDARINVPGVRVFGQPLAWADYSLEVAHQYGTFADTDSLRGNMVDGRIGLKYPDAEPLPLDPKLNLQYTLMSGDGASGASTYNGWYPVFGEYPMFTEELTGNLFRGPFWNYNWTNLQRYATSLDLTVMPKRVVVTPYWEMFTADCADYNNNYSYGSGSEIGNVLGTFIKTKPFSQGWLQPLECNFYMAYMLPGSRYLESDDAWWYRMEFVYRF